MPKPPPPTKPAPPIMAAPQNMAAPDAGQALQDPDPQNMAAPDAGQALQDPEDPWAIYMAHKQARQDPVWGVAEAGTCLAYLPDEGPAGPHDYEIEPDDPESLLENMRSWARFNIDEELLEGREQLWSQEPVEGNIPEHIYLKGRTLEAHVYLHHWVQVVREDLGCDQDACQALVTLLKTNPKEAPYGYNEACRILAHMLKDKQKQGDFHDPGTWSKWMKKACLESIEALENWNHVKDLNRLGTKHDWDNYHGDPGEPGSSSWEGPGKGKGKVYHTGFRG